MQEENKVDIFSNPVALAVIAGAFIVAVSVIASSFILKGGSIGSGSAGDLAKGDKVKIVDRKDAPTVGNKNAKLTIYEFGDFQCPFCKKFFSESYSQLKAKYIDTGKAKLVYIHFPLNQIHPNAQISSEASECASRQGKFENYYSILYAKGEGDGTGLDSASLKRYASDIGLDTVLFNKCLDGREAKDVVEKDLAVGNSLGINGTPSFVIDGEIIVGAQPFSALAEKIDAALD